MSRLDDARQVESSGILNSLNQPWRASASSLNDKHEMQYCEYPIK